MNFLATHRSTTMGLWLAAFGMFHSGRYRSNWISQDSSGNHQPGGSRHPGVWNSAVAWGVFDRRAVGRVNLDSCVCDTWNARTPQPSGDRFPPEEDTTPGMHAVAVMNYGTWQSRFGGAEDIVGKTLRLNRIAFTVIGVAPPQFIGVNAIFGPDLWIPAGHGGTVAA
jgi:hypothetical protein